MMKNTRIKDSIKDIADGLYQADVMDYQTYEDLVKDILTPDELKEFKNCHTLSFTSRRLLLQYFKKDRKQIIIWTRTANIWLGGLTPNNMLQLGKAKKLNRYIKFMSEGML